MKPVALPRGIPRLPATARTSRRTATRALHTRAQPSSRALRPSTLRARDFLAQPSQQPAHTADTQTAFAQHILPPHCTTHLPRSSLPRAPRPPSPDRGPAPPPLSRRPALPVKWCATCPAVSSCAHAGAAAQHAGHSCTCPTSHAQRVGSGILARIAYGCWHICRDTQDASVQVTGLAAVLSKLMLMSCAEHILQLALQHTCNAGTHMQCSTSCGQMLCCCGFVPIPARAGMGWTLPLNRCSQGLVVRGICPLSPVFLIVFLIVIQSLIKVSRGPRPSILPYCLALRRAE
jgi:hypothetical protein